MTTPLRRGSEEYIKRSVVPTPNGDGMLMLQADLIDVLSGYTIPAILDAFIPGEVRIRAGEPLPEERSVIVRIAGAQFFGEILYCRRKESGGYDAHVTINDVDDKGIRRQPRLPIDLPGHLLMAARAIRVTVSDISRDGLRIETPVALQDDETVVLAMSRALVFGTVRYCRKAGEDGFRVGIEMQHVLENIQPGSDMHLREIIRRFAKRCLMKPSFMRRLLAAIF